MEDKNTRIYLIGFMGCGKSYTGKHLAESLGWDFLDLDRRIEQDAGQTIAGIFADAGEDAFRVLEQSALHQTRTLTRTVVSCGGGLPCFFDNMEWMNRSGLTIFLNASVDLLARRLSGETGVRPLLQNLKGKALQEFITDKLRDRLPFYEQAEVRIDLSMEKESALEQIQNALPFVMFKKYK